MNECGGSSWQASWQKRSEGGGGIVRVAIVKFRNVFVCDVKTLEGCSEKNLEGQMMWASHPPPSEYWMGHGTVCCLLLMVAGLCLLAQVLHLQNKQVIVVPTTVISLPPSAPSTLLSLLCLYCYFCLAGVFCSFLTFCSRTLHLIILAKGLDVVNFLFTVSRLRVCYRCSL